MTAQTCVKIKVTDTEFKHANKSCNPVDLAVAQTLGVDEHPVQTQRQGVLIFNNYDTIEQTYEYDNSSIVAQFMDDWDLYRLGHNISLTEFEFNLNKR